MEHTSKGESAFVGIETSKLLLKAVLLSDGEVLCKVLENDLAGYRWLRSWLQRNDVTIMGLRVCLRMDAPYSEVAARAMAEMGMLVCDAEPGPLQAFARGCGLPDGAARGAVVLAQYCAATRPPPWTPPSPACVELRLWLRRLQAVRQLRQQEMARLENHFHAGQIALHQLLRQQIACLDTQIRQHEIAILAHVRRHPDLPRPPELARSHHGIARYTSAAGIASGR